MSKRRDFLRAVAAAPLVPAVLAQTAPAPPRPSPQPSPSAPSDVPGPVAVALTEAVRARFGDHLAPGDLEEIRKTVHGNLQAAERLRAVPLANADEPVTMFAAAPLRRNTR